MRYVAVRVSGHLALGVAAFERDGRSADRVAGLAVGDRAVHAAAVADGCERHRGEDVEPALAEHVVVVDRAAALRGVDVDRALVEDPARGFDVPDEAGAALHRSATAPARCGVDIDVPEKAV